MGLACARLGRPWHDLPVVSLHGRTDSTPLFAALARQGQAAVYTDAVHTPAVLAARIRERGGDRFALTVCEDLGLAGERISRLRPEQAASQTFSPLNLVLVEALRPPEVALGLGLTDEALLRRDGVFTKFAARALVLAALDARPGDVLYDIGAGVGTVALPASLTNPGGPVHDVRGLAHPKQPRQEIPAPALGNGADLGKGVLEHRAFAHEAIVAGQAHERTGQRPG